DQAFPTSFDNLIACHSLVLILESLHEGLTVPELKTSFLASLVDVYKLAAITAVFQEKVDDVLLYTEKARARAFLDQVGNPHINVFQSRDTILIKRENILRRQMNELLNELYEEQAKPYEQQNQRLIDGRSQMLDETRNAYRDLLIELKIKHPEYASMIGIEVSTLHTLQNQILDDNTTLISYINIGQVVDHKLLMLVIDRENTHIEITNTDTRLRDQIGYLRNTINEREFDQQTASTLYNQLITPLKPHIHNENLIIIPHGSLHYLPFAALWNEEDEHYLIEEYNIVYAPSASVLHLMQEKSADNINHGQLLAMGNADRSLQSAEQEVAMVADLFDADVLTRTQATESQFYTQAPKADIIHLAVHGDYNPINPLFTNIQLVPDDEHDGRLDVHELYNIDLSESNLAVLSACDTSLGVINNGEEIIGLTRAFIYAGTPAVMTTLWPIDDMASATLMESFYTHWQTGMTAAEALRSAQLEVLAEDEWTSPYYWAAFGLTGDYR
ncbi:MAG: CHAT domain-containing protein, partial [Chloroflexota bacterium]